jgi:outer membrane protein
MSRSLRSLVACLALVASTPAWATASFANKELGLGVGGFGLFPSGDAHVEWGVPATLEGGFYLESGFALYLRIPFMLLKQTTGELVFGMGGQLGVRYLLLEEAVRPYVMLHLAALVLNRDATSIPNVFAGPGTGFGVDFFVTDSVSLGLRATADLYLTLTQTEIKVQVSLGGAASIAVYF